VFLTSNGAISWQSRKQTLIAMSTLKATFITCLQASRDVKQLHQLQKDIHASQKDSPPLPINCNNQAALTLGTTVNIKALTTAKWQQQQCTCSVMNREPAAVIWVVDVWMSLMPSCGRMDSRSGRWSIEEKDSMSTE